MNKITGKFAWRFIAAFATVLAWAASAAAQVVVVGTGNPDIDVPAVQAAVDLGGEVILRGHFSFDRPPTVTPELEDFPMAMVLVSREVAISGVRDERGEMATIEAGQVPFEVEAHGSHVAIQGLRFVRPKIDAINVLAATGLLIASCKIEGVDPPSPAAISVNTTFFFPTPDHPGRPEFVSGTILVVNNDIDVTGSTELDNSIGISFFSIGVPGAEVDIYASGNRITNVTEPAINLRRIGGRAQVVHNAITTGSVPGRAARPQVIRVANTGSYLIAHNSIDVQWPRGDAMGIGVLSQVKDWPMERAIVVDNDVTMSPPEGTVFTDFSAAIGVFGFARGNVVVDNRIRGRARAALSVPVFPLPPQVPAVPANNAFVLNRFDDFEASLADVFVGSGAMNTRIVGQGTVEDHGVGTVIVPVPF